KDRGHAARRSGGVQATWRPMASRPQSSGRDARVPVSCDHASRMKRLVAALLLLTTSVFAADNDVERIAGSVLVRGHSMQYVRELTEQFGPRLIGTSGFDRAAEWAAAQFRAAGVTNVRLEEVPISRGWKRGSVSAHMVAPFDQTLPPTPFGGASPPPAAGVRGHFTPVTH